MTGKDIQLSVRNLQKRFASDLLKAPKDALKGASFEVMRGEIFGFLGPNGAGKTTTIKAITGLLRPDDGEITISGLPHTDMAAKAKIGFMPESPGFYSHLTAEELLLFYTDLLGTPRVQSSARAAGLLKLVGLKRHGALGAIGTFSKGMLQRLALAQALINDPELVILDEPMSGLDPVGRRDFRDIFLDLKDRGVTVFFSSHIIPDVESLCDRVAILIDGVVRAEGHIEEIVTPDIEQFEIVFSGASLDSIRVQSTATYSGSDSSWVRVNVEDKQRALDQIIEAGGSVLQLNPVRASLEDVLIDRFQEEQ